MKCNENDNVYMTIINKKRYYKIIKFNNKEYDII